MNPYVWGLVILGFLSIPVTVAAGMAMLLRARPTESTGDIAKALATVLRALRRRGP